METNSGPNEIQIIFQTAFNQNANGAYSNPDPFGGFEQEKKSKAEARENLVDQFKTAAQSASKAQIYNTINQLMAHLVQFCAVGGSTAGTEIPEMMKGCLAFMEDL
jgi:hypothetical protein